MWTKNKGGRTSFDNILRSFGGILFEVLIEKLGQLCDFTLEISGTSP